MGIINSTRWSESSTSDLKDIFDFYKHKSLIAARKVVTEIVDGVETIHYSDQYPSDEINPDYRRMIIRHFKLLYKVEGQTLFVARIFDTWQNPKKQSF